MDRKELLEFLNDWENMAPLARDMHRFPEYIGLLMEIAFENKDQVSWRAAWMADKIHEKHPEVIEPFLVPIILQLKTESHTGKKRHFLKLVSMHPVPDEFDSFLMDYCLNILTAENEPPAVRVHAMQVLFNISEKIPDLKPELADIIENEMEFHPTPGILTRGKKLAAKLRKQIHGYRI